MEDDNNIKPALCRIILTALLFMGWWLAPPSRAFSLEDRVKEFTLDNGLRILVVRRQTSPTFSAYIRFLAGGVDEQRGQSGTAHILEHMLFKGTETIGTTDFAKESAEMKKVEKLGEELDAERRKGGKAEKEKIDRLKNELTAALNEQRRYIVKNEMASIYSRNGGSGFNAFTSIDTTTYVVSLPANKFELWAWMESDRMRSPVLREYYPERDVVLEERRRSIETSPNGALYEMFISSAYIAHPYGRPIIGWMSDISVLPKQKVAQFLKTYYSPNNAVVTIVGDLDPGYVYKTMKEYFGDIPAQAIPPRFSTVEPPRIGERRIEVEFDAEPRVMIGFHKPTMPHKDDYVFDVIHAVLTEGRTSRLYKSLVLEKGIAVSIGGYTAPGSRYDNLYVFHGTPRAPHTTKELEEAVYAELEKLKTEPISGYELQKVINNTESDFIFRLGSNSGLARSLSEYKLLLGDWRYLTRYTDEIKKITSDDVMEAAKKYFVKSNRTVTTLVQKKRVQKKKDKNAK